MSFVGNFTHSLDSKKRVFIPAEYRSELGDVFYITRKGAPYLTVYTEQDWELYVEKISALPESVAEKLQDFLFSAAQKCTPDASGRIIIKEALIKHAGIDKSVVFVGAGKQLRIWAEEKWKERDENRNLDEILRLMSQYSL